VRAGHEIPATAKKGAASQLSELGLPILSDSEILNVIFLERNVSRRYRWRIRFAPLVFVAVSGGVDPQFPAGEAVLDRKAVVLVGRADA
jgi:hypothetical protein